MKVAEFLHFDLSGAMYSVIDATKPGYLSDLKKNVMTEGDRNVVKDLYGDCEVKGFQPKTSRSIFLFIKPAVTESNYITQREDSNIKTTVDKILEGADIQSAIYEDLFKNKAMQESVIKPGVDWAGDIPGREDNGFDYCYFYYHHFVITKEDKIAIAKCISNNDYTGFKKLQHKYNVELNPKGWEFLPDEIWDDAAEDHVPLNKNTFSLINFVDCECG